MAAFLCPILVNCTRRILGLPGRAPQVPNACPLPPPPARPLARSAPPVARRSPPAPGRHAPSPPSLPPHHPLTPWPYTSTPRCAWPLHPRRRGWASAYPCEGFLPNLRKGEQLPFQAIVRVLHSFHSTLSCANGFELSRRPAETTDETAKDSPKRETLLATILDRAVGCGELLARCCGVGFGHPVTCRA
jgi:hypothetical protein